METYSLVLENILTWVWQTPWNIIILIEDTKQFMKHCQVQIHHIYREENQMEDYLANLAIERTRRIEMNILSEGKHMINLDKNQCANLRIKTRIII